MEFLFTNQIASIEALIIFTCIFVIFAIFAYDGYLYSREVFLTFFPKRPSLSLKEEASDEKSAEKEGAIPLQDVASEVLPTLTKNSSSEAGDEGDHKVEDISPIQHPETPEITLVHPVLEEITADEPKDIIQEEEHEEIIPSELPISQDGEKIELPPTEGGTEVGEDIPQSTLEAPKEAILSEKPEPEKEKIAPLSSPLQEDPQVTYTEKVPHHRKNKKDKLLDIVNNVKTLIARGQFEDAKGLLVSGLALEKNHRELNIIMASLYERDHAFAKAEYVLKDIAATYPDDTEILTHLATDLAMQRKYEVSYEIYKKVLSLGGGNEETLYTLTHLASEMDLPLDVTNYARMYLKQYPHNPDILWLYSQSQIANGERREAIDTLIKLKNLTPYNQEIADLIQKLVTEEELAGNFGEK